MNGKYSSVAKTLHWVIALLIVLQFVFIFTADEMPRGGTRDALLVLHFSTGITVLLLAIWRVIYRNLNSPPAPEPGQSPLLRNSALFAHWLMYGLIFALPISGWMTVATKGVAINWYWLVSIPNFVAENEEFHELLEEVHEVLGYSLLVIASIHLLAALWHHFIKKDDTLKRMLPGG